MINRHNSIAKRWKELSGKDDWKKLLHPLDIDLRRYIIHYGERAQVTYDSFNSNPNSKNAGNCRYAKDKLFANVGLEVGNPYKYEVVEYIYATSQLEVPSEFILKSLSAESWCKQSNFMGYVAVTTDEGKQALGRRDILIAWRGTAQPLEWAEDFYFPLTSASILYGEASKARVHSGYLSIYTSSNADSPFNKKSARDQVLPLVQQLLEKYKNEEVSITVVGHSLGAALATLNAVDIATNGFKNHENESKNPSVLVTAFLFGSSRVGDSHFLHFIKSKRNLHILSVCNVTDIVPTLPPKEYGYKDVGEELLIDARKSNFTKSTQGWDSLHNLEGVYLHGIAGTQGINGGFHLEVKRDIALVNKNSDLLKNEYLVPVSWWVEKNNGMVQKDDGTWYLS